MISSEDIEFYHRTGWLVSDHVIDGDLVDLCVQAAERIYRCEHDRVQPWSASPHIKNFNEPYADRTRLRVDQFPSFHSDAIRRLVCSPEIGAIAAALLGTDEVRYYKDILIGAPTGRHSSIGWHTDISYWPTCVPERMITVYVPLEDRDERSGTLLMINGSQRWVKRSFNITADLGELDKIRKKYEAEGRFVELHALPHRRGQVSFHSSLVVHATYPNMTDVLQHSVVIGLQAGDNRFVPSPLKRLDRDMVVNLNDEVGPKLPDGTPDIKNDDFYPVVYRAPGAGRRG
ncbi:MAG: phytanoyl-CoA dioxygenase family protein [Polyangiaceae bacterium]|nr:phytanoyl-CoA dioxygenase family protein [Polyangiaceae bacterium]